MIVGADVNTFLPDTIEVNIDLLNCRIVLFKSDSLIAYEVTGF